MKYQQDNTAPIWFIMTWTAIAIGVGIIIGYCLAGY